MERLHDGRRVPQGLVGRVVRARDGGSDVLVSWWTRRCAQTPTRLAEAEKKSVLPPAPENEVELEAALINLRS